jgi:hypothetical protein
MGNSRSVRRKLNRSTAVLLGRFSAEVQEQGQGGYIAKVQHDEGCPGLTGKFLLKCTCAPEISITKVTS